MLVGPDLTTIDTPTAPFYTAAMARTFTTREVAEILGLSKQRVSILANSGRLPASRDYLGRFHFAASDVRRFAKQPRLSGIRLTV